MRHAKKMVMIPEELFSKLINSFKTVSNHSTADNPLEKIANESAEASEIQHSRETKKRLFKKEKSENKPLLVKINEDGEHLGVKNDESLNRSTRSYKSSKNTIIKDELASTLDDTRNSENSFVNVTESSDNTTLDEVERIYLEIKAKKPAFLAKQDLIYKKVKRGEKKEAYMSSSLKNSIKHILNPKGNAPSGTKIVKDYIKDHNLIDLIGRGLSSFKPKLWPKSKMISTRPLLKKNKKVRYRALM